MKFCFFGAQAMSLILSLFVGAFPSAHAAPAQVSQDAFINAQRHRANSTLGSRTLIKVSPEYPRHGLLQFDLTGIEGDVASAILTFSVARVISPGNIGVHAVLNPWDERTVTFNLSPSFNPSPAGTVGVASADVGGIVSFDIAQLARTWASDPANNHGLALISQSANVEIYSKEGGMAATLEVVTGGPGGEPSDNTVTVELEGGDYSNPADAVDNAFAGDKWCDDQNPQACKIFVGPGSFLVDRTLMLSDPDPETSKMITLRGAGIDVTTMTFAQGVDIAIANGGLSALTVVHAEPSNTEKTGWFSSDDTGVQGNDLRILVEGGAVNYGVRGRFPFNEIALSDASVRVSGGVGSAGIHGSSHTLKNVVVRADGENANGVHSFGEEGSGLFMEGSKVTAIGSSAIAVNASNIGPTITGSSIASNGNAAKGIFANFSILGSTELSSTTVRASGAGSIALHIRAVIRNYLIERSNFHGETALLFDSIDSGSGDDRMEITTSTLTGTQVALALHTPDGDIGGPVKVDNSVLTAPTAIEAQDRFEVGIGASKLSGAVFPGGSSLKCVYVYNATYDPLDANCL